MEKHVTYKSPILVSQIEKEEKNPFTFSCINFCVYFISEEGLNFRLVQSLTFGKCFGECNLVSQSLTTPTMMANFMYQLHWAKGCPGSW